VRRCVRLDSKLALESPPFAMLGVKLQNAAGDCRIAQVFDGGPAQRAGLAAGDVLVALDGLRVTGARVDSLLARYQPGDAVQLLAFRREELMSFDLNLSLSVPPRFELRADAAAGAVARRRRMAWCGARGR
jgi:predicted metalloprotease with PDZ domain